MPEHIPVNLLFVSGLGEQKGHQNLSGSPSSHRTHVGIHSALYPGHTTALCGQAGWLEAVDMYQPDLVITSLLDENREGSHEQLRQLIAEVPALREKGIIVATDVGEGNGLFFNQSIPFVTLTFQALAAHDFIFYVDDAIAHALPLITTTPIYHWREGCELCSLRLDAPYPETERSFITVLNYYSARQGHSRGGVQNYVIARELLKRFPQYQLRIASSLFQPEVRTDELLDHMGLQAVPPPEEFTWQEYTEVLTHSALFIHMDMLPSRGQPILEAASCGTPIITTRAPAPAQALHIGVANGFALTDAVEVGTRLLSDEASWDRESHRLFALSKAFTLEYTRCQLDRVIRHYQRLHPDWHGAFK